MAFSPPAVALFPNAIAAADVTEACAPIAMAPGIKTPWADALSPMAMTPIAEASVLMMLSVPMAIELILSALAPAPIAVAFKP